MSARNFARVAVFAAALILLVGGAAALRAGDVEKREKLGSFRFALRDLPPMLAPAPPIVACLKDGKNENFYEDDLRRGSIIAQVERREAPGPRDTPEAFADYELVLVTRKGQFVTRAYYFDSAKFRVQLLFPGVDVYGPGPKPDAKALRQALGMHIVFEGKSAQGRN